MWIERKIFTLSQIILLLYKNKVSEMNEQNSNMTMPDYYSEDNWNKYVSLLPKEDQSKAPSYAEAAKNLEKQEEAFKKMGMVAHRVKVDALELKSWVEENNLPLTRESVGPYTMHKFVQDTTGKSHTFIDETKS